MADFIHSGRGKRRSPYSVSIGLMTYALDFDAHDFDR